MILDRKEEARSSEGESRRRDGVDGAAGPIERSFIVVVENFFISTYRGHQVSADNAEVKKEQTCRAEVGLQIENLRLYFY